MAGSSEESPSASAPPAEESADAAAAEASGDTTAAVQEVKDEVAEVKNQELAQEGSQEAAKEPEQELVVAKEVELNLAKEPEEVAEPAGGDFKVPVSRGVEEVFQPAVLVAASPDTMREEHRQLALDRREVGPFNY